jgi:hypothetical protein
MSIEAPSGTTGSIGGTIPASVGIEAQESIAVPSSTTSVERSVPEHVFSLPKMDRSQPFVEEGPVSPLAFRGSTWATVVQGENRKSETPLAKEFKQPSIPDLPQMSMAIRERATTIMAASATNQVVEEASVEDFGEVTLAGNEKKALDVGAFVALEHVENPGIKEEDAAQRKEVDMPTRQIRVQLRDGEQLQEIRNAIKTLVDRQGGQEQETTGILVDKDSEETPSSFEEDDEKAPDEREDILQDIPADETKMQEVRAMVGEDKTVTEAVTQQDVDTIVHVLVEQEQAYEVVTQVQKAGLDYQDALTATKVLLTDAIEKQGKEKVQDHPEAVFTAVEKELAVITQPKKSAAFVTQTGEAFVIKNASEQVAVNQQESILANALGQQVERTDDVSQTQLVAIVRQQDINQTIAQQLGVESDTTRIEQQQEPICSFTFVEDRATQKERRKFVKAAQEVLQEGKAHTVSLGMRILEKVSITSKFLSEIVRDSSVGVHPQDADGSLRLVINEIGAVDSVDKVKTIPTILEKHTPVAIEEEPTISPQVSKEAVEKVLKPPSSSPVLSTVIS